MLSPAAFDAKVPTIDEDPTLSAPCRAALYDHYVGGVPVVEVMARHKIGQPRFYGAVERYGLPSAPKLREGMTRVVTIVPDERINEFRFRVAQQLAAWAQQDQKNEKA